MAGIDPNLIMIGSALVLGIAILIALGIIRIKGRAYATESKAQMTNRTTVIDPDWGIFTLLGMKKIGGHQFPITTEFGPDRPLPIDMRPYENMFPLNPDKLAAGDPDGALWIILNENNPFIQGIQMRLNSLLDRNTLLSFRNHYLENQNLKLSAEVQEMMTKESEFMGKIRRNVSPPQIFPSNYGRGGGVMVPQGD